MYMMCVLQNLLNRFKSLLFFQANLAKDYLLEVKQLEDSSTVSAVEDNNLKLQVTSILARRTMLLKRNSNSLAIIGFSVMYNIRWMREFNFTFTQASA